MEPEDVRADLARGYPQLLCSIGIGPEVLAKELKAELNATVTKTQRLKGAVQDALPKGYRIIAETEEEALIQWEEKDVRMAQNALFEAHKLFGLYPAAKHEVTGRDGGPIQSEAQLAVQAGPGLRALIARFESSGIGGSGSEDDL